MQRNLKLSKRLKDIAELIDGEIVGDGEINITGVCGIKEAQEGDITFVANPKYLPLMDETHASAIITYRDVLSAPKPIVRVEDPSLAFAKVVALVLPTQKNKPKGIHHISRQANCKFIKRWNLMVPLFIVNQVWEEPGYDDI